ncbi:hypothetical protein [Actinomadura flavalba]|uniref:hypothetical protein n=1 Tax=Actinomadura flavalba TaxID=1120938 RepID=UPI00039F1EB5|nr:hypothetical protein [Actinomadura flavalba]
MNRARVIVLAAASLTVGTALLTPAPANAAPVPLRPAPAAVPDGAMAGPPTGDFTVRGVRIRATPRRDGHVRGHGNPGDRYTWNGGQHWADQVTCPNGEVKDHWTYVINNRTKVEGYVSDCYIRED